MKKIFGIVFLILGLFFISLGTYSYYTMEITLGAVTEINDLVLNVEGFDDSVTKTYTLKNGEVLVPGDSGEFVIDVNISSENSDVYLTLDFDKKNIPSNLNFYLDSNHTILLNKYFKVLEKNSSINEKITVFWYWDGERSDEADNKFMGKVMDIDFTVDVLQLEYAYIKNGSFSEEAFWNEQYKDKIRTISFGFATNNMAICSSSNLCFDVSSDNSPNNVFAYLTDSGYKDESGNILYDLKIMAEAFIFAPSDLSYFFSDFTNLVSIDFKSFITTDTTDMSYMFNNCEKLEGLDLSDFSTDNVKDMKYMFNNCKSLKQIDVSSFNTNKVIYMNSMFKNNSSLITLNLSNFISNRVANVNSMFYGMSSLELLDMRNFVFESDLTGNINNYSNLFTLVNNNSIVIVKNSQEQAFVLGLGYTNRPINWSTKTVVLY